MQETECTPFQMYHGHIIHHEQIMQCILYNESNVWFHIGFSVTVTTCNNTELWEPWKKIWTYITLRLGKIITLVFFLVTHLFKYRTTNGLALPPMYIGGMYSAEITVTERNPQIITFFLWLTSYPLDSVLRTFSNEVSWIWLPKGLGTPTCLA